MVAAMSSRHEHLDEHLDEPGDYHGRAHDVVPFDAPPNAKVVVPGSKSITNRALIIAALAQGTSTLRGILFSDDTEAMLDCLQALGIFCEVDQSNNVALVQGCGGVPPNNAATLNVRQSGTTARFIVPLLALARGDFEVDGHPQMRSRPMDELATALRSREVSVTSHPGDRLPFTIASKGGRIGGPIDVRGDVSSQFLSGLLLSSPCTTTPSQFRIVGDLISRPYVDMTISMMRQFGASVREADNTFTVEPSGYEARDYVIEPDASAASYFFGLAAITGGEVTIDGLGAGSLQGDLRFVHDLAAMGCDVTIDDAATSVQGPPLGALRGGSFDMSQHSDTAPTMAAVAVFASSPVTVTGVGFIRHKESDRVGGVVRELMRCGIVATELPDGFTVEPGIPSAATIETYEDHRMAMSFSLLGCRVAGIKIANPGCVAKTFPNYFETLADLRLASSASGRPCPKGDA